jgi:hypothetical protein
MSFGALASIHEKCDIQDSEQVQDVKNKQQLHHNIFMFCMSRFTNQKDLVIFSGKISYLLYSFQPHLSSNAKVTSTFRERSQMADRMKYTFYNMEGNRRIC